VSQTGFDARARWGRLPEVGPEPGEVSREPRDLGCEIGAQPGLAASQGAASAHGAEAAGAEEDRAEARAGRTGWLVLVYRPPVEPSTARVRAWRRVRELGGLYIQQAVAVFPARSETERAVLRLSREMRETGVESFVFRAETGSYEEAELVARFRAQSDQEYREILEQCTGLLGELDTETRKGKFTFAEIEENEGDLAYIERWVERALGRDFFGGTLQDEVLRKIAECRARMEEFEQEVFRRHTGEQ